MPAPQKISLEALHSTTAMLVEDLGPEQVTMKIVADRLGVRPPSLYKHVADREALLGFVRDETVEAIAAVLAKADRTSGAGAPATERLRAQAHAVRRFALRRPQAFGLVFQPSHLPAGNPDAIVTSIAPLLGGCRELVGDDHALEAARTITAWLTGFVAMENASAFQLDGDIDDAFAFGIDVVLAGITATAQ